MAMGLRMATTTSLRLATATLALAASTFAVGQAPPPGDFPGGGFDGPPPFGPEDGPGFGPPGGGRMGPGGPMSEERKILAQFDKDGNGRLEGAERDAARDELRKTPQRGPGGRGGMRGPGGPDGGARAEPKPGPKVAPADVAVHADAPLFAPDIVRTVFLEFDVPDWEAELELFHNTDADVPARMTVDGRAIEGVGVHFRGASSYMMVPRGTKRSFNIAVDHTDPKATLHGQNTLNFLNCNGDASFMSAVLYAHLARPHIPAPRANFVHVVVNGESWGLYANVEQFNKAFLRDHWADFKGEGARWKVKGSPNATGGLDYRGEDLAAYRQRYEIKTKDSDKDWKALVRLCRTLSETPIDELEAALKPMLDIDGALWFLALDIATANSDGYWTRASDYSLYRDPKGVFHIVPHDMNEAFKSARGGRGGGPAGGPGGGFGGGPGSEGRPGRGMRPRPADSETPPPPQSAPGLVRGQDARPQDGRQPAFRGPRGGGADGAGMTELDPLTGLDDATKPLRSRLLQVPALREKYLGFVRQLAAEMAWQKMSSLVAGQRALVSELVGRDTRKAFTTEAFERDTSPEPTGTLRQFFEKRSKYLLGYTPKAPAPAKPAKD